MNDYWNDPPENPEIPECCDTEMDMEQDGTCRCSVCGAIIAPQPDYDTPDMFGDEEDFTPPLEPTTCPHGNKIGECGTCDYESDLAYDAARERRLFGR